MSTGTDRLRKRTLALGLAVPFALAMAPCPAAAALHVHVHQTAPIHVHIEAPKHVDAHHVKGTKLPAATGTVLGPPAPAPAAVSGVLAITTAVLAPAGSIHAHTSRQHQAAAAVLSMHPSFTFRLARLATFPGILYLQPEPAEPFVAVISDLERTWPEYPRYGGLFDAAVPHVTIAKGWRARRPHSRVAAHLPLSFRARHVELWHRGQWSSWRLDRRFPLSG